MKLDFIINSLAMIFFISCATVFSLVAKEVSNRSYIEGEVLAGSTEESPAVNLDKLPAATSNVLASETTATVIENTPKASTGSLFDEAFEWLDYPYRFLVIPQTYFEEDGHFRKDLTIEGELEINDVNYIFPDEDKEGVLSSDGQGNLTWDAIEARITDFLGLNDTPNSYSGSGSQFVAVNSAGTALEFVDAPAGTTISGTDNRLARFNAAGDNVENSSINDLYTGGVVVTIDSNANIGVGLTGAAFKLDVGGTSRVWNLISQNISLSSLSTSILTGNYGFNGFTNFSGGIGTGGISKDSITGAQRLTSTGNLVNIGSIQGGEMLLTGGGTFASSVEYTANRPHGIDINDVNGDGNSDVITASTFGTAVSVFINNGDGTYASQVTYSTGSNPYAVATGDVNGDGMPDIATANFGANRTSVFINNGDGTFATKVDYVTGTSPLAVAMGDVNGDGKADLAVANSNANTVSVLLNNGDGTFATKVDYATGVSPQSVSIGDIDGDGKADLAVGNFSDPSVSVFINIGGGTFATKVDYTTASGPESVVLGDVNDDGMADMVTANQGADSVSVLINDGDGTFAIKVDYAAATNPEAVTLGDLNGDGKADLAVANWSSDSVSVLMNNGNGTFATKVDYSVGTNPEAIAMGDLNGDGKSDLAVANGGETSMSILMNNPSVVLTAQANTGRVGIGTTGPGSKLSVAGSVGIGSTYASYAAPANGMLVQGRVGIGMTSPQYLLDVGGTGRVSEFITESVILSSLYSNIIAPVFGFSGYTNFNSGIGTGGFDSLTPAQRLTVAGNLINIGSYQGGEMLLTNGGTFATKVDYATEASRQPQGVDIGDLNGDRYFDLAVKTNTGVSIFINDGDGTFAENVDYEADWQSIKIIDLNGDGAPDLAGGGGTEGVTVLMNNGDGTFGTYITYTGPANTIDLAAGDLNGDGKPDLAAIENGDPSDLMVYMNNGDGTFGSVTIYTANTLDLAIEIGDVNGDGWADIVESGNSNLSVFINNGDGTFATKVDYALSQTLFDLKLTDLNGDGKLDVAGADLNLSDMVVVMNNGDGTFAGEISYDADTWTSGVAVADFNGDGKTDVVVSNTDGDSASLFLNNGDGTFAAKVDYDAGTDADGVEAGDLNNDGKADFVIANRGADTVSVFINQSNPMLYAQASTGRVGIGTTNPGSKLSIAGAVGIGSTYASYAAPANGMIVQGAVGIGTTNPGSHALSVVGTAGLSTGTAWTNTSDRRFKNEQSELYGSALSTISQLRPVTYEWNQLHNSMFGEDPGLNYGFIAQEIGEIIPEMVTQDSSGYYYYNPSGFEAILTAAIQEQQDMIDELNEKLDQIDSGSTESEEEPEVDVELDLTIPEGFETLGEVLKIEEDEGRKRTIFFSDMNVSGNVTADSFSTLGEISIGFLTISADDNSISVLGGETLKIQTGVNPGNVELFEGTLVMTPDGGITAKAEIHAKALVAEKVAVLGAETIAAQLEEDADGIDADSTVGEGTLSANELEVVINNINVEPESKIFVTATTGTGGKMLNIKSKSNGSFVVAIDSVHNADIKFDYWILEVR